MPAESSTPQTPKEKKGDSVHPSAAAHAQSLPVPKIQTSNEHDDNARVPHSKSETLKTPQENNKKNNMDQLVHAGEKGVEMTSKSVKKSFEFGSRIGKKLSKLTVKGAKKTGQVTVQAARTVSRLGSDLGHDKSTTSATTADSVSGSLESEDRSFRKGGNYTSMESLGDHSLGNEDYANGGGEDLAPIPCGFDTFILSDSAILWVVVLSIALDQFVRHYQQILHNQSPLGVLVASSLLAFVVGLEYNETELLDELKMRLSGMKVRPADELYNDRIRNRKILFDGMPKTGEEKKRSSVFQRIFHKRSIKLPPLSPYKTVLSRRKSSVQNENQALRQSPLMKRLERFGRNNLALIRHSTPTSSPAKMGKSKDTGENPSLTRAQADPIFVTGRSDFSMGSACGAGTTAEDLLLHVTQPLCELRGRDLFRTEAADPEMITHPFLIEHGLRDCSTFLINILTVFGNICIYFKLPEWVKDWDESLVEKENDLPSVKAMKRFLSGDDAYRKRAFKVMPELVEGPAAVRMLAPRNKDFPLEMGAFMTTVYQQEPPTGTQSAVMSLTLDLVTNNTIRGLVGIFKRNMHRMTVDFACIIDPDKDDKEEPSAVLGLWRMDHVNFEDTPELPDRFATQGATNDARESIRASMLVSQCGDAMKIKEEIERSEIVAAAS